MPNFNNKSRKEIGDEAEDRAAAFLSRTGYLLLERNYRIGRAEVDIVAEKNGILVLVEVKFRRSNYFGYPEQTVSKRKIELYHEAAYQLQINYPEYKRIRMDIISIEYEKNIPTIWHFEDCF